MVNGTHFVLKNMSTILYYSIYEIKLQIYNTVLVRAISLVVWTVCSLQCVSVYLKKILNAHCTVQEDSSINRIKTL